MKNLCKLVCVLMAYYIVDFPFFRALFAFASVDPKVPISFSTAQSRYFYELFSATTDRTLYVRAVIYRGTSPGFESRYSQVDVPADQPKIFIPVREEDERRIGFSVMSTPILTTLKRLEQLYTVAGGLSSLPNSVQVIFPTETAGKALKLLLSTKSLRFNGRSNREIHWDEDNEQGSHANDGSALYKSRLDLDEISNAQGDVIATLDTTYYVPLCCDDALIATSMAAANFVLNPSGEKVLATLRATSFYGMCNQILNSASSLADYNLYLEFLKESVMDVASYRIRLSAISDISGIKAIAELPSNLTTSTSGNVWLQWSQKSIWTPCAIQLGKLQLALITKALKLYIGTFGPDSQMTLIISKNYELVLRIPLTTVNGDRGAIFTFIAVCGGRDL